VRLETERLILREWREEDKALYAEIIGDAEVRRFFPGVGTYADADAGIERAKQRLIDHGYTFLATERKSDGAFVGMLGMAPLSDELRAVIPSSPPAEIGWQFGKQFWGQGFAPEGALAMLDFAWNTVRLPEIGAITYRGNLPSRRVMEKIGMTYDPSADFEHPSVPEGHALRPHVLYRIRRP
jgi:RimJ/RimL family protein N-acetyltransferase